MLTRKKIFFLWGLLYFGIPFFILLIGRVVFLLYYRSLYEPYSWGQIFINFLHGFRFDFALVAFLYGVPFLLLLVISTRWQILGLKILSILVLPLNLALAFIQTVGIGYFEETGRHLSFEILFLFSDFPALTQVALKDYKLLVFLGLFLLVSLVILFFVVFYIFSKKKISFTIRKPISFFSLGKEVFKRIAIFLLIVLLARGGWQLKPLSITHAFYHGDQKLGSLAFGAPFSLVKFLSSLSEPLVSKQWLSNESATTNSQTILTAGNKDIFLSKEYPFYRKLDFENREAKKKNLVVIVMESWSANYIAALEGANPETTPFFNELSNKGVIFENFFAVGSRSIQGVSSVMFSLPSIEKLPIYQTPFAANRMPSLPLVLSKAGYESIFFHAGHEGSLYLHSLAKVAQYDKVFSLSDLKNTKERYDGTWGLWDHFAFLDFSKELSKLKPPFHGMFFSLTSHTPYSIPSKDFEYFSKEIQGYKFLNSLRYSDWALKQFFQAAQQYDWYRDTIFFIIADHNRGIYENKKLSYQIPLLIFSPDSDILPERNKTIGSQIDILPTALSLLKINFPFAAAGKDLLSMPIEKSYALVSTNQHYWITPQYIYIFEENSLKKTVDFETSQPLEINQQEKIHKKNINNFLSFFQTSFHVILDNKIVPTL